MALLGGGAGNPVGGGGSFTGPAEQLEISGDFGYAYSGPIQISTGAATHLDFTTGNYTYMGELTCSGQILIGTESAGGISIFQILFNGVEVLRLKIDSKEETSPSWSVVPLLIPAYTEVVVQVDSDYGTSDYKTCASLLGMVYRDR